MTHQTLADPVATIVPAGFADLAPFVERWAVPDQNERHRRRVASSLDELRAFYDAIFPLMPALIEYLNTLPLSDVEDLQPGDRNLYLMGLSFMMVSLPIDLRWKSSDIPDGLEAGRVFFRPA